MKRTFDICFLSNDIKFSEQLHQSYFSDKRLYKTFKRYNPTIIPNKNLVTFNTIIIYDISSSDQFNIDLISFLKKKFNKAPIFVIINTEQEDLIYSLMCCGIENYIRKEHLNRLQYSIRNYITKQNADIQHSKEIKKIKKELKNGDSKYQSIFENTIIGLYRFSVDGKILLVNPAFLKILGYSSIDEFQTNGNLESLYITPEERIRFFSLFNNSDSIVGVEFQLKKKDGSSLFVRNSAKVFRNGGGEILYFEGTIEDISGEKRTEIALADSVELYKGVVESLREGLMITDIDDKILYVNNRIEVLTGYSARELLGEYSYKILIAPDSWNVVLNKNKSRFNDIADNYNIEFYRKDGSKFWASIKGAPYKNSKGVIAGTIGIISDISEIIESAKALHLSEENYKTVVDNVREVIFQTNPEAKITFINPFWEEITGYKRSETIHNSFIDFIYAEDKTRAAKKFVSLISGRKQYINFEIRFEKKDGSIRWMNANAKVSFSHDAKMLGVSGTLTDIHDKKIAEEELIIAKEKAEESDRLKSLFLAQISHEIRTPVNNILNYTSMVQETDEAKSVGIIKEAVESIGNGGKRLVRTIDLILNMSMVQTGNYDLSPKLLNLEEILFKLVTEFSYVAETKNLKLFLQNDSINANVFVDEYTIIHAFQNLIDNGIKYTKNGHVGVTLFNSVNGVSVSIEDTGIGISKDYLKKIFQPFTQEESGYSRSFEGNGLGLALTKKYFEMNNAKISVESEKGKGTKFKISFCNN